MRERIPREKDEKIRTRTMTVKREKGGISVPLPSSSCRAHQFAQRLRHAAGLVLGADRDAQPVGEPLAGQPADDIALRSEEHTSELQSLMRSSYAVFCLKKKKTKEQQKTMKL